ncbi:MAG TPA: hypothetical protein VEL10_01045 [Gaiellaceae bacterium]|nr:hypothetical protein [Gaiellaceae bacterium]
MRWSDLDIRMLFDELETGAAQSGGELRLVHADSLSIRRKDSG